MDAETNSDLPLANANLCKCWLMSFDSHCRAKLIEDKIGASGISPKTDKFIEKCGTRSLLKVVTLFPGKLLETLEYKTIRSAIMAYIEPQARLVIAERTNFLEMK